MNPIATTKRVIAVESEASLAIDKSRLRIRRPMLPDAFVSLEDLGVIVLDYAAITLTVQTLAALAEADVVLVACNARHVPIANSLGYSANSRHAAIVRAQSTVAEPTRKRIWQQIVVQKIRNQSHVLAHFGADHDAQRHLMKLAQNVTSGDSGNAEAQAAVRYFPALFGSTFIRRPQDVEEGRDALVNAMLDYGYAIVRAAVARAICGAGLHPAFGVFHRNAYNPYALADDLMEPIRPMVDAHVRRYADGGSGDVAAELHSEDGLTPIHKRWMLGCLTASCRLDDDTFPLLYALELYAANLRRCLIERARRLDSPCEFRIPDV